MPRTYELNQDLQIPGFTHDQLQLLLRYVAPGFEDSFLNSLILIRMENTAGELSADFQKFKNSVVEQGKLIKKLR